MWKTGNEGLIQNTVTKKQFYRSDTTLTSIKVYNAPTTTGILSGMNIPDNASASAEMQAQIQEALRQQNKRNPQKSYGALAATYVGSFMVSDGPLWNTNPDVLSGVEAAALIFGGSPSDYAISTNPNTTDPSTITHTAWASSWGKGCVEVAEDYSLDLGAPGYNDPPTEDAAVSAYVSDWCFEGQANYVWLADNSSLDNILYVDKNVSGGNGSGDSWANAIPELADALKYAQLHNAITPYTSANPLQIWVAGGTYKPLYSPADNNFGNDAGRDNSFLMVNNVQLYGGFAGTEATLAERDLSIVANETILSGDINGDDVITGSGSTLSITNNSENNYRVLVSFGAVDAARLDGFVVTGGNANGTVALTINGLNMYDAESGGGMYNLTSSPGISNVHFNGNSATYGGGVENDMSSSPTLTNTTLIRNSASYGGGGMYNYESSSPNLTNVTLSGNSANYGGGMYNNQSSSPSLINVTLSGNSVTYNGGGMYNLGSFPTLTNTILWGNTAINSGNGIYNGIDSSPIISYSLVQDIDNSAENGLDGTNAANAPQFTNAPNGDYSLLATSPVINLGSNIAYTNAGGDLQNDVDLAGNPRVYDYANGGIIDMGAYEYQGLKISPDGNNILYVDKNVSGGNESGGSWANAVPELADALKYAQLQNAITPYTSANPLQIWVAGGTYKPLYSPADNNFGNHAGRDNSFLMVNNVQLYGGFAGTEAALAERDLSIVANETILSGDIAGNDALISPAPTSGNPYTEASIADNNYHVLVSSGAVGTALLDGFTITGGNTKTSEDIITINGVDFNSSRGGGMYLSSSSPGVINVILSGNSANEPAIFDNGGTGGGMYITASSPIISNVTLNGNSAGFGGGMYNDWSSSSSLTNVTLSGNSAKYGGGGMRNYQSSPSLVNVAITGNHSAENAGGMDNDDNCSPTFTNVTLSGNSAVNNGGGLRNYNSSPTLTNSIVWGNTAVTDADIHNENNSVSIISFSLVRGVDNTGHNGLDGTDPGNDPQFTNATNGDYSLLATSPVINLGSNLVYTNAGGDLQNDVDLAGNPRVYDYANGGIIDMGAYEFQGEYADPTAFITTWKTTSANESITIPVNTSESYDYTVNWGDGSTSQNQIGNASHTYATAGTHKVSITGNFPAIYFYGSSDYDKIISIDQWGTNIWHTMEGAFTYCSSLEGNAPDTPDLSEVLSTNQMFARSSFNQDIGGWDVSNVRMMIGMFENNYYFNQNLDSWNVSNVKYMSFMFSSAYNFNGNIGSWNVGSVLSMGYMFWEAQSFNQDIGGWDVHNVTDMSKMFSSIFGSPFDQDLGDWDVSQVTTMSNMFDGTTLSTANYDALLIGWNAQNLKQNVEFSGGNSTYCAGAAARANMIASKGWTITDGGSLATDIDALANQTAIDTYTLLPITGSNLSGNESYYTQSGGNGTAYPAGTTFIYSDFATYPVTLYLYDENSCSSDEESFDLTITQTPPAYTTLVSLASGILTIQDLVDKDDDLTISYTGGNFIITDNNGGIINTNVAGATGDGTASVTIPNIGVNSILAKTLGGDDTFTVDFSGGNFNVPINYEGGSQTGGDILALAGGGTFDNVTHNFTNKNDGSVSVSGNGLISYTGLEPIIDNLNVNDRVFNYTGAAETITLNAGGSLDNQIVSTLGESVDFNNPNTSLTINTEVDGGSGADVVNIEGVSAGFDADLAVNGGSDDNINFQTNPTNIGNGSFEVNGQTVSVTQNITTASAGAISLTASKNITVNSSAIVSSADGDITFHANAGATLSGVDVIAIAIYNDSKITTSGSGNIEMTGVGVSTGATSFITGIVNSNSSVETTGSGSILLTGTGGDGSGSNYGIRIDGVTARVTSINGGITLNGTAGNVSGSFNEGVAVLNGAIVEATGTGMISATGVSGTGTDNNRGVILFDGKIITAGGGVTINGISRGTNSVNEGVSIDAGSIIKDTNGGNISLTGTGGNGVGSNNGINIIGSSTMLETNNGSIVLNGTGGQGSGNDNVGVTIESSAQVRDIGTGDISIVGNSGTGVQANLGVQINGPVSVTSNGGDISISGTANAATTGIYNIGTIIRYTAIVSTTGSGAILIDGTSGGGTGSNYGLEISTDGTVISTENGDMTLNGSVSSSSEGAYNLGVYFNNALINSTGIGAIQIEGAGGNGTHHNYGIYVLNGGVENTGSGNISFMGIGGDGTGANYGICIEGATARITTIDGGITLTGTAGNGTEMFNDGIVILLGALIEATGTGAISATGNAGAGTDYNRGVVLYSDGDMSSAGGGIAIDGTGGGTGNFNYGITLEGGLIIKDTNGGSIALTGTGGNGDSFNHGINISDNANIVESNNGSIALNGIGGDGTSDSNVGVAIASSATLRDIGTGSIQIIGTSTSANRPAINIESLGTPIAAGGGITATANVGKLKTPAGIPAYSIFDATTTAVNGILAPGQSPGQLAINGNFAIGSGDALEIEINGVITAGADYDQVVVNGTVDITDATLTLVDNFTGSLPEGHVFTIINNTGAGAVVGTFNGLPEGTAMTFNGQGLVISYNGGDGNDVVLEVNSMAITNPFITTWETTSANESITIPIYSGLSYDYTVDWGDGNISQNQTDNATHIYSTAGIHTVKIIGTFPMIYFSNSGDKDKLMTIQQWGDIQWDYMIQSYYGCSNLTLTATDAPDLSNVQSMYQTFRGATSFNGDVSGWDVQNVTDFSFMFFDATSFNGDISGWDVESGELMWAMLGNATSFNGDISGWDVHNVITFGFMFYGATAFNGDISGWDVQNAQSMPGMFRGATAFNGDISGWNVQNVQSMNSMFFDATAFSGDISGWDVQKVEDMNYMFSLAAAFDGDISGWDVQSVQSMYSMFNRATAFNSDISGWNVQNVQVMDSMFYGATAFDRSLGGWDIRNVMGMPHMFGNAGLSTANYDATLIGWNSQLPQNAVIFDGGNSTYSCAAADARENLITTFGWTITDGGGLPGVSTLAITNLTATTATANGSIICLGSSNPTAHGFCWNTTGTPTTADDMVDKGEATVTGAFAAVMSPLLPNTTYYVRAFVTNDAGTSYGEEQSFSIDCINPTSGGTIAENQLICEATAPDALTSSILPDGFVGTLEYQWQVSSNGTDFTNIPIDGTFETYSPEALTASTWYRRLVKVECESTWMESNVLEITVRPQFTPGAIDATGETICYNGDPIEIGSATLASGGDENITYVWYRSTNDFTDSTLIAGAILASYNPPTGLTETTSYRRYAHDGTCNIAFEASAGTWKVTVYDDFTAGAIATAGETICYGGDPVEIVSDTDAAGGDENITYQWESSIDDFASAGTVISGAESASYNPPAGLTATTSYRRFAHDGTCNIAFEVSAGTWKVTVYDEFTSGAIEIAGETICYGGDPIEIFSDTDAAGGDENITYQWESSTDDFATAGTVIPGAESASYNPPAGLTVTTSYRRYAHDGTCNIAFEVSAGTWKITIQELPVADAGSNGTIVEGETFAFTNAGAVNYSTLLWSSVGDGTFNSNTLLNPVYTPGNGDIATGEVELCLTAVPESPCLISDTDCMTLTILRHPEVAIVSPADSSTVYNYALTVLGTASDADGDLAEVYIRLNEGAWHLANGTENWSFDFLLDAGYQKIEAKAVDAVGLESPITEINIFVGIQEIDLSQGWSAISSFLAPIEPALETVMSHTGTPDNLIIMMDNTGIYWPGYNINSIGNWDLLHGYKVKYNQADVLTVYGDKLQDQEVTFDAGLHFIPVLSNVPVMISNVFTDPENDITYLFDISTGQIYWPQGSIYTIDELIPGRSYLTMFSKETTITFPDYQAFKSAPILPNLAAQFAAPWQYARTGEVHLISLFESALSGLENYAYIGVFDSDGVCIGCAHIAGNDGNILLTVYGDDVYTTSKDGANAGEGITFLAYDPATGQEVQLTATFSESFPNTDGLFTLNGLSAITGFKAGATGTSENGLNSSVRVYPNPAEDYIVILVPQHDGKVNYRITNMDGRMIAQDHFTGTEAQLDVSMLNPGLYMITLEIDGQVVTRRIVVM